MGSNDDNGARGPPAGYERSGPLAWRRLHHTIKEEDVPC
jgi:hypothetical protein